MLILWGRANSPNVMKITWLLDELQTPCQRLEASGSQAQAGTAALSTINPNGRVPILQHGELVLWESNAILRYLATILPQAAPLYPAIPATRANIERWMDWQQTELAPPLSRLFQWSMRTPAHLREPRLIDRATTNVAEKLEILEAAMPGQGALTGPSLSLADFAIAPLLHRWFSLPLRKPALPRLQEYHETLLQRPSFQSQVAAHTQQPKVQPKPTPLRVVA